MRLSKKVKEIQERCPEQSRTAIPSRLKEYGNSEDDIERVVKSFRPLENNATHCRSGPLPRISGTGKLVPTYLSTGPKLANVICAIQWGESVDVIQKHLDYYHQLDNNKLRTWINADLEGYPAMFYLVETDNAHMVRLWAKYGGDPNATCGQERFPLLAFAILHGRMSRTSQQKTTMVELLLSLGASVGVMPRVFYTPFYRKLPASGPVDEESTNTIDESQKWMAAVSRRAEIVLSRRQAKRVLGLPYTIVGQHHAVKALQRRLVTQLAIQSNKPLIFMFAGPSGHGKTEIARSLGKLLSLDTITIDCTTFTGEVELFGPRPPFYEYEWGSPLNNFLVTNSGRRSIVFMDEFEKTSKDIHNTLLIPFDQGEYLDRRDSTKIDCSKMIWVLATNKFDKQILNFSEANQRELIESQDEHKETRLLDQLISELKKACISNFGAPLSGRVSEIIPFLPFSPGEQAVISHKGLMSLEETLRSPVVVSPNEENDNLVGNIRLEIADESRLCSVIAQESYTPQLGARCILNAVTDLICTPLVSQYLEVDEDLCDDQPEIQFKVGVTEGKKIEVWRMQTEKEDLYD